MTHPHFLFPPFPASDVRTIGKFMGIPVPEKNKKIHLSLQGIGQAEIAMLLFPQNG